MAATVTGLNKIAEGREAEIYGVIDAIVEALVD